MEHQAPEALHDLLQLLGTAEFFHSIYKSVTPEMLPNQHIDSRSRCTYLGWLELILIQLSQQVTGNVNIQCFCIRRQCEHRLSGSVPFCLLLLSEALWHKVSLGIEHRATKTSGHGHFFKKWTSGHKDRGPHGHRATRLGFRVLWLCFGFGCLVRV